MPQIGRASIQRASPSQSALALGIPPVQCTLCWAEFIEGHADGIQMTGMPDK